MPRPRRHRTPADGYGPGDRTEVPSVISAQFAAGYGPGTSPDHEELTFMVPDAPAPDLAVRALQAARNRDHDAAALALELLRRDPFVHPAVGGAAFGYGPVHTYRLIKAGKIPSVRVGGLREGAQGRIRVPSAAALQLLGYPVQAIGAPTQANHADTGNADFDGSSDGAL